MLFRPDLLLPPLLPPLLLLLWFGLVCFPCDSCFSWPPPARLFRDALDSGKRRTAME